MPNGLQLVTKAITSIGMNEQGGIPSVSDSNDALVELNAMWESFGIDEGLIYAEDRVRFPLGVNIGVYTIGKVPNPPEVGQTATPWFNGQRPARIYSANILSIVGGAITAFTIGDQGIGYAVGDTGIILGSSGATAAYAVASVNGAGSVLTCTITAPGTGYQLGNGQKTQTGGAQPGSGVGLTLNLTNVSIGGQQRSELRIVNADTYYAHRDLSATAYTPDELYPDFLPDVDGFMRLYLYPVPSNSVAPVIELVTAVNFVLWTLQGNYYIPQGYFDLVTDALAYRLLSTFGIMDQNVIANVTQKAEKAESRLREANRVNRKMTAGSELPPAVKEQIETGAK